MRNCRRIRAGRAPSALRSPISRILSVTETSMMFMTPIPPTSNEMAATPASRTVNVLDTDAAVVTRDAWLVIVKSAPAALVLPVEPLGARTPDTVNGVPLMVTLWPTTSVEPKSSAAVVAPRTTTDAAEAWSALDRNTPLDMVRARTDNQEGVVPTTVVVQLLAPATRDCELEVLGATAAMSGATTGEARACASAWVSVEADPNPPRSPVVLVVLPGEMINRLVPRASTCAVTCCWAPMPSPTVRITAAIPMRIPRTVSAERIRWLRIASRLVRKVSNQVTTSPPKRQPHSRVSRRSPDHRVAARRALLGRQRPSRG